MTTGAWSGVLDEAVRANAAGRPGEAERMLRRLLAETAKHEPHDATTRTLVGRAWVTLALARHDQGDPQEADRLLRRAEQVDDPSGTVTILAGIQRAGLAGREGRWVAALTELERVAADAPTVSPRAAAVVALNRGLACQFLGRFDDSAQALRTARTIADAGGAEEIAAAATHNLGRLAFCRGEVLEALRLMSEAERADVRPSGAGLDRARVLLDAGLLDAAEHVLVEVTRAASSAGLTTDLAEADLERARQLLLDGRYAEARVAAARSADAFARLRATAWRDQAQLVGLRAGLAAVVEVGDAATGEDPNAPAPAPTTAERASAIRRRALRLARRLRGAEAAEAGLLAVEAGLVRSAAPRLGAARSELDRVRKLRVTTLPVRLHDRLVAAMIEDRAGHPAAARHELRRGLAALTREQGRHASLDTRTAVAVHGRGLVALDLDLALRSGRAADVLLAAERWRGVSQRLPRVVPAADPELAALVGRARQTRLALADTGLDPAVRGRLEADLVRLDRAVRRRDWTVRAHDPARDRRDTGAPASYAEIAAALTASRARLVVLFDHRRRLGAAVLDASGCRVLDLAATAHVGELAHRAAADLRASARAPQRLRQVVDRSAEATLAELGALLAPAVAPGRGPAQRLVVVPTASLASLPWRMLPGLGTVPVTVSPSATFWLRGRLARPAQPRVVALAGPDLPGAAAEARAVARHWPGGRSHVGRAANRDALVAALRGADVVHLAAHGTHREDSALFSTLRMADGPVFAHELQREGVGAGSSGADAEAPAPAAHVLLSACEAGRAVVRSGGEPLGLTAALQACGVRSVVAAAAPVGDAVAAAVMGRYHRRVAHGTEPAVALAEIAAEGAARLFCTYGSDW